MTSATLDASRPRTAPRHQRPRPSTLNTLAGKGLISAVAIPATAGTAAGASLLAAGAADAATIKPAAAVQVGLSAPTAVRAATSTAIVTIGYGSTGSLVKVVQQRVGGVSVDGVFGPKTLAAVKSFQSGRHLVVDGVVGPLTWKALGGFPATGGGTSRDGGRTCTVGATLRYNATGSSVKVLQKALGLQTDGWFGPVTLAAVKSFQSSKALVADGVVGPVTWKALGCTPTTTTPPVTTPPPSTPPPTGGTGGGSTPPLNLARAAMWDRIAWCESGQRWSLVATNSTGTYYGGLMMTHDAWRIGGGLAFSYNANQSSREEQITVANSLYAQLGLKPWSCRHAA
ncbi:peptidoglycan-binding protein [Branchiibius sp. NY16-3462-2]|uniref:peptidoglycan-binding protein n=1 Tax=Branchiibius sp. NY16-3462-2 TaxID=1807500 RepID=UPI000793F151|nr:peptidoglycan-binding protein [Branchiibius sp. NY16-3462-2]KYH45676.1 hypothetical protein AZH51_18365 [Branchiibius sp. NY16-3462-2]